MILLTFDISGREPKQFQQQQYKNEKQRSRLISQAKNDAANSPTAVIWIVDVTKNGIDSFPLEEA